MASPVPEKRKGEGGTSLLLWCIKLTKNERRNVDEFSLGLCIHDVSFPGEMPFN